MWTCNHVECFPIDLCNWISFEGLSFKIACTSPVWFLLTLLGLMVHLTASVFSHMKHFLLCESHRYRQGQYISSPRSLLTSSYGFYNFLGSSDAFPDLADSVVLISLASSHHLLKNILATLSPTQLTREFVSALFFRNQFFRTKEFVSTTMFQLHSSAGVLPLTSIFNLLRMLVGYSVIPAELVCLQSQHSVLLSPHCVLSSYLSCISLVIQSQRENKLTWKKRFNNLSEPTRHFSLLCLLENAS